MLPFREFIIESIKEIFPDKEIEEGSAIFNLLVNPITLITQPLVNEINNTKTNQSLKRILELDNPNEYPKENIDDILSNLHIERRRSKKSKGIARLYFNKPIDKTWTKGSLLINAKNGKKYENDDLISVTSQNMAGFQENGKYFFDIFIQAVEDGKDSNIYNNDIFKHGFINVNDSECISVSNVGEVLGGLDEENNIDFINRSKDSIGIRSMCVENGINSVLFEKFSDTIREVKSIGATDFEMMRDLINGVHVCGCIDIYAKTNNFREGNFQVIGLMPDYSRKINNTTTMSLSKKSQNLASPFIHNTPIVTSLIFKEKVLLFSLLDLDSEININGIPTFDIAIDGVKYLITINASNLNSVKLEEIVFSINSIIKKEVAKTIINPTVIQRRSSGCISNKGIYFEDYNNDIFKFIKTGDYLHIHNGKNKGHYKINHTTSNKISLFLDKNLDEDFNISYSISRAGKIICITAENEIVISPSFEGSDCFFKIFGFKGIQRIRATQVVNYLPNIDFEYNSSQGKISRIENDSQIIISSDTNTGIVSPGIYFYDSLRQFNNVISGDILRIIDTPVGYEHLKKDYRILSVLDGLRIEGIFAEKQDINVMYQIRRNKILEDETVSISYTYSPLSIDIGSKTQKNNKGKYVSIRDGREKETISTMAFIDIIGINLIDPNTKISLPIELKKNSGYGRGGYGRGGFGRGEGSDYKLVVNDPNLRFSDYENSMIELNPIYTGQSFNVSYRFAPEIPLYQRFVEDETERVLSANLLIRAFHPGYVDLVIKYRADYSTKFPAKDYLRTKVAEYINSRSSGVAIYASDIIELISREISNNKGVSSVITPIKMRCTIHNKKGDISIIEDNDVISLLDQDNDPFKATTRITRWIANDIQIIPVN